MNCHAASRLYVRANGTVPCNCDTGESTPLFRPNLADLASFDFIRDCFNGPPFQRLRRELRAERAPIGACSGCYFFHPSEPFTKFGDDGVVSEIEHVQIESSFHCGVDCDACVVRATRTDPALSALGDGPYEMPLPLFEKLVADISRAGLPVREMAFCGRGEPLLHPQFTEMMRAARAALPDTYYSVVTSGNAPYCDGLLDVDYISASIDGGYPDSYEVYRRGGKLQRALNLLERVVVERERRSPGARKPRIAWKYILFSHNDSEEEIMHAQRIADAIGVDEMVFVLTHTWNRSQKYLTQAQIDEGPEFKVFTGERKTFSNVNIETNNIANWEKIGDLSRDKRFTFDRARETPGGA
ncbi:MAG: hypothetical protein R3F49_05165 [Planctomycetota bacterium]